MVGPIAGVSTKQSGTSVKACLSRNEACRPEKTKPWCSEIFGEMRDDSDHVQDVWRHPGAESEFAMLKEMQKESTYQSMRKESRRGQAPLREVFGKASKFGDESASELVNAPCAGDESSSLKPGEQLRRNYDWNIDVMTHRFGSKGPVPGFNGASSAHSVEDNEGSRSITSTRLENFKSTQPKLGRRGSEVEVDEGRVYGRPSVDRAYDAGACLRGSYSEEEQQPDVDLGTTLTPGYRNFRTEQVFGVPTVRSDIPKYERRSISDSQNYGDDACARQLIYPSRMMAAGLDDAAELASKPRTKQEIQSIFTAIGTPILPPERLDSIYDAIQAKNNGIVTLDAFRREI